MNEFVKSLGIVLILIGVIIFIVYSQIVGAGNIFLWSGIACVILGVLAHILLNKYMK